MDTPRQQFILGGAEDNVLPDGVYIVARPAEIARVQSTRIGRREYHGVALEIEAPVPEEVLANAQVLVVEIEPGEPASMRRVAQVRAARPELPLVIALPEASVALMRTLLRQGVSDVTSLPIDAEELTALLVEVVEQSRRDLTGAAELSPLTAVVRSTGGCGATTVLTHLAAAFAKQGPNGSKVCLIDLDIQFGMVATLLGERVEVSVSDLFDAGDRIDAALMRSAVVESRHGFAVIGAPHAITPLETVETDQLIRLIDVARREYDHVLIDLPANWTNWALSAAVSATNLVLLTDLSIAALRQARRRLELFRTIGVPHSHVRVVINRMEKRLFRTIGVEEVRTALAEDVFATLPADGSLLATQDQGLLVSEVSGKSKFARSIAELARKLAGEGS